jgi:cell division protein FtsW
MSVDEECLEDYCWQSQQANIAVGSGGFFGKGLTQGVQKSYWLPQASDDFIFAASAEELGFIRIIFVIIAYFVIALRGFQIASRAETNFETSLAVGITTWITVQAFINMAVNTAIAPVTGITLPFISYGGSSLVASLIGIAILLNISQRTTHYAHSPNRGRNRRTRYSKPGRYRRA